VFQLATIDAETGAPRVRTLVFRGFLSGSGDDRPMMLATTDIRSGKVRDLAQRADVEVCWWVEARQEQFRMAGRGWVVGPGADGRGVPGLEVDWEEKRKEVFNSMSPWMRASWCVPVAPGTRVEGGYEATKAWRGRLAGLGEDVGEEERRDVEVAFGNFGIVVVEPVEVDYLELGVDPNRRTVFRREEKGWVEEEVVA
jgi:pyridoxamine 5'-phosphate oxidase